MDEENTILDDAYIVVDGGKISHVGSKKPDMPSDTYAEVVDGKGNVLMPGLVNTHSHIAMTAMRGHGDGNNLQDWLQNYIFPVEEKWDDRSLAIATSLGLCEMISSGITAFEDMYVCCDPIAQSVASAGMNANITNGAVFFGETFSPENCPDCQGQTDLYDKWHGYDDGRILVDAAIHAEYTSTKELHRWIAEFAKERNIGVHLHLSETEKEHMECVKKYGLTPTQVMEQSGIFDTRAIVAHAVWTSENDWDILAKKGVSISHNPCSNLKLGSGIAPIVKMRQAGINVTLGTDGVASNNTTDLFEDMKIAGMLQNGVSGNPTALLPIDVLRMATVNGGKALGRKTGCIAKGFDADLILIDFDRPNLIPCHNIFSNLVYAAHGSDVILTMCRGKILYRNGEFLTIDLERVKHEMKNYVLSKLF